MDIKEQLVARLDNIAPGTPCSIKLSSRGLNICITLEDTDRLSCVIKHIAINTGAAGSHNAEALELLADSIPRTVSQLPDSLALIECDRHNACLLFRSQPPERNDTGDISYYELLLGEQGHLSLSRYCYERNSQEKRIQPFPMTRETLIRLIDTLIALLAARQSVTQTEREEV